MKNTWYDPLRSIRSLGSQKEKIANMGELAEQRRKHLGQFFTPDAVAAFMWQFVASLPVRTILDNSIGSARLLQFADPEKHRLYGVDVHGDTVEQVKEIVSKAGFECDIECAGMQDIQPANMDVALINPPFSIHLESPFLQAFVGCTRMGRFGPHTSATSDEYALYQALDAAYIVVALLPKSTADVITGMKDEMIAPRLRAVFDLPANTFKEEDANVLTSVLVFGEARVDNQVVRLQVEDLKQALPALELESALGKYRGIASLRLQALDSDEPVITLPVTGNPNVHVALDGRRIKLAYECGFTRARVENAVLSHRIFSTEECRLPKGIRYAGEGKLDLEAYLMQTDPVAAFDKFLQLITDSGGKPVLKPGVMETIRKKVRRTDRQATPLRHIVWTRGTAGAKTVTGKARKTHNVDPAKWISPVIKEGEEVIFTRLESGQFVFTKKEVEYTISADDLEARFTLVGASEGWHVVHEGLLKKYPEDAARLKQRAIKLGIDKWLSWDFQLEDLIELTLKPAGGIAAWRQACGKSRLAAALILLSGVKHGLIVLESRLIDEMIGQLAKAGIDMSTVHVIDAPGKLQSLKQINLIAYERLRMPFEPDGSVKLTYAKKLRRRIGLVVADEGEKLANMGSDQSRALFQLSARKRYILTGTPIPNYPRDTHGLLVFVDGDGTATQPYGYHRGYVEPRWINSMEFTIRGIEAVRRDFVVVEWCTWEFAESLREGAKREIPKIANVEKYRAWLAPHIKRRVIEEPDVAKFIQLPPLPQETIKVEWDERHLGLYLETADEFAEWYRQDGAERRNNLAILLARLQAVQKALNCPQDGVAGRAGYEGFTSKQTAVFNKLVEIAREGKRALLFAENPTVVKILHKALTKAGIEAVPFHGGISIKKRVEDKDRRFVNGKASHLLATKATARAGYNLPMADYVIFYDQSWSWRIMDQAMRRPLRPERKEPVKVLNFVIPGSLDEYQQQMVAFKKDSADAGLDWATPELDDAEFLHMTTILERFIAGIAKLRGMKPRDLRKQLKLAA